MPATFQPNTNVVAPSDISSEEVSAYQKRLMNPDTRQSTISNLLDWKKGRGLVNSGESDAYLLQNFPGVLESQVSSSIATGEQAEDQRLANISAGGARSIPDVIAAAESGKQFSPEEIEALTASNKATLFSAFPSSENRQVVEPPTFAESFKVLGTIDAAASVLSDIVGVGVGAVTALPGLFSTGPLGPGFNNSTAGVESSPLSERLRNAGSDIERIHQFVAFEPLTPAGRSEKDRVMQAIGPWAAMSSAASSQLGIYANEEGLGPNLTAALMSFPLLAEAAATKGVSNRFRPISNLLDVETADLLKGLEPLTPPSRVARQALENAQAAILEHPTQRFSGMTADVRLSTSLFDSNGNPKVVPDAPAREMLEQNFTHNAAAVVSKSSPATRAGMQAMLNRDRAARSNAVTAQDTNPLDEFGTSLSNRLGFLQRERKTLGTSLGEHIRTPEFRSLMIPMETTLTEFYSSLREMGVSVVPRNMEGNRVGTDTSSVTEVEGYSLDFAGTTLDLPVMSATRSLLTSWNSLMNSKTIGGEIPASTAHNIKKSIDEIIDVSKASEGGLTGRAETALKNFRQSVNTSIQTADPAYKAINEPLSNIIETMSNFDVYLPRGSKWSDSNISSKSAVGPAMAAAGENKASAQLLRNNLTTLERTVQSNVQGRPIAASFTDEPTNYLIFNALLTDYFQPIRDTKNAIKGGARVREAITSIANEQVRAVADGASSAAARNVFGMAHAAPKVGFSLIASPKRSSNRAQAKLTQLENLGVKALENALRGTGRQHIQPNKR
tara:strand:- start:43 stop:2394 length:2352 start_codon:yes stop_codon:yes gene_type:complete